MGNPVSNSPAVSQVDVNREQQVSNPQKKSPFAKAVSAIASAFSLKTIINQTKQHPITLAMAITSAVVLGPTSTLAVIGAIGLAKSLIDKYRAPSKEPASTAG